MWKHSLVDGSSLETRFEKTLGLLFRHDKKTRKQWEK